MDNNRAAFFIDGFNLYHSIDNNPAFHKYKWLDLFALCRQFLKPVESIENIYYLAETGYLSHMDNAVVPAGNGATQPFVVE